VMSISVQKHVHVLRTVADGGVIAKPTTEFHSDALRV
jgi:hypothetical protein